MKKASLEEQLEQITSAAPKKLTKRVKTGLAATPTTLESNCEDDPSLQSANERLSDDSLDSSDSEEEGSQLGKKRPAKKEKHSSIVVVNGMSIDFEKISD